MKKIFALSLVLVLCLSLFSGCGKKNDAKNDGGSATAMLTLIDKDEQEYTYELQLSGEVTLREALWQNKLITEDQYGAYFIEIIDGHEANVADDGCTWMPLNDKKEMITGTFDEITIKAGDTMYLQYYVVPDFD